MASTRSGNGWTPCSVTRCPRKSMASTPNLHLATLITRPCSANLLKSRRRWRRCCLASQLAMRMSSKYTKRNSSRPRQTWSINLWKACAAFLSPKGILRNSKRPNGVITAVFGMSMAATGIWLYPRTKSILEKIFFPSTGPWNPACEAQDINHA